MVKALPNITYFNIKEEDLDGNKEVLSPLLNKNSNKW
jgi:hypothetical protein